MIIEKNTLNPAIRILKPEEYHGKVKPSCKVCKESLVMPYENKKKKNYYVLRWNTINTKMNLCERCLQNLFKEITITLWGDNVIFLTQNESEIEPSSIDEIDNCKRECLYNIGIEDMG